MKDFKLFLKYIFNFNGFYESLRTSFRLFTKPKSIAFLFMAFGLYFLIKFGKPKGYIICATFLIISLIIQLRIVYLAGEHIHWNRQRIGIVKPKILKEQSLKLNNEEVKK